MSMAIAVKSDSLYLGSMGTTVALTSNAVAYGIMNINEQLSNVTPHIKFDLKYCREMR